MKVLLQKLQNDVFDVFFNLFIFLFITPSRIIPVPMFRDHSWPNSGDHMG